MKKTKAKCFFEQLLPDTPIKMSLKKMIKYLEEFNEGLADPDKNPEDLLNIGETPLDESVDKEELYKYTTLACVLLNLEETIIKS